MIERKEITGRTRKPAELRASVSWWFKNDDEQQLSEAPWYQPDWPQWKRELYWNYFRNPLQNFRAYVVGVSDRNYTVVGRAPVMTVQRDDLGETGWQWCLIRLPNAWLPFVSYAGKRIVFYAGWQPNGFFGFKFNIRKEPLNVRSSS